MTLGCLGLGYRSTCAGDVPGSRGGLSPRPGDILLVLHTLQTSSAYRCRDGAGLLAVPSVWPPFPSPGALHYRDSVSQLVTGVMQCVTMTELKQSKCEDRPLPNRIERDMIATECPLFVRP